MFSFERFYELNEVCQNIQIENEEIKNLLDEKIGLLENQ